MAKYMDLSTLVQFVHLSIERTSLSDERSLSLSRTWGPASHSCLLTLTSFTRVIATTLEHPTAFPRDAAP